MTKPSKESRAFVEKHRMRVIDTNKRAMKYSGLSTQFFKHPDDYNAIDSMFTAAETEPLYTVEISESELERIAQFESQVFNNMQQKGHYALFETLMEQKEREKRLKDTYPAVKKAYEHYSLLLKMAETGDLGI